MIILCANRQDWESGGGWGKEQKRPDETNEWIVNNWGNGEMEKRKASISHESSLIGRAGEDLPPPIWV